MKDLQHLGKYRVYNPVVEGKSRRRNGAFLIKLKTGLMAHIIASVDGEEWEHVSASNESRCLTWDEMCEVKDLFFDAEECVIQFHPPKSEYVNLHDFCLHLWRPVNGVISRPK